MRWSSRSTRGALLAYALLAILILGGVTWGTIATLRLERSAHKARLEKEHQNKIAQARTRLDGVVGRIVQYEEARPVRDYTSYYSPSALFQADWTEAQARAQGWMANSGERDKWAAVMAEPTGSVTRHAPTGKPPPSPLAVAMISGVTPVH